MLLKEESREDPRITRTRQLLRRALLELMKEKSFQAITIQDIADRATVNRVTFYAHFQDKYALLEYIARETLKEQLHTDLPVNATPTPENLASLIRTLCEFLRDMHRRCPPPHGRMDSTIEKQVTVVLQEVLLSWLEEAPHSGNVEQKATIAAWSIYGAASQWSQHPKPVPVNEYVRQVLPIIQAGLDAHA
jgi:AcrR family transcriptional regulator